jgi:hypothetical protein
MVIPLKYKLILVMLLLPCAELWSQGAGAELGLVENSIVVRSSPDEVWKVLSDFAGIGDFHVLYEESSRVNGESDVASLGLERIGLIPNGNFNVILTERIVQIEEGSHYTYEVTDWENIALGVMRVTYGVRTNELGSTELYSRTYYEMSNGIMTRLFKSRFQRDSKDSLISYKYYIETGGREKDRKRLRKWFREAEKDGLEEKALVSSLEK